MIDYTKLFVYLLQNKMKKTDLIELAGISSPTLAKLSKNESITTDVICKICKALNLQPGDIMEYIPLDKEN